MGLIGLINELNLTKMDVIRVQLEQNPFGLVNEFELTANCDILDNQKVC